MAYYERVFFNTFINFTLLNSFYLLYNTVVKKKYISQSRLNWHVDVYDISILYNNKLITDC